MNLFCIGETLNGNMNEAESHIFQCFEDFDDVQINFSLKSEIFDLGKVQLLLN